MSREAHIEALIWCRDKALVASRCRSIAAKIAFGNIARRSHREVADRGEHHLVGGITSSDIGFKLGCRETRYGGLRAEDVMSELRVTKYQILEVVIYTLRRRILI